ncbi:MAG: XisI protein [Spirulina sp. SIO3F2]|nr:XisI protein [Spirulina sp. SIO3F2]
MDRLAFYRKSVKTILQDYHAWVAQTPGEALQSCLSLDEDRDQYLWFNVGWQGKTRIFNVIVCVQIKAGKVWVEEDWTRQGIVDELLQAGIAQEDIVLGFQHPTKREFTGFAVA